ncbi:hypothetical protein JCM13664_09760 [Methylothermus subterraneus]
MPAGRPPVLQLEQQGHAFHDVPGCVFCRRIGLGLETAIALAEIVEKGEDRKPQLLGLRKRGKASEIGNRKQAFENDSNV